MDLSIFKIILYILIPFGSLYARIFDFNGSLDHPWLLFPIFFLFPCSIVPILMMAFGFIKKGNGPPLYDNLMWIPVIIKIILTIILSQILNSNQDGLFNFIIFIITFISMITINAIKNKNECKEYTASMFYKNFVNALFEYTFPFILIFVINLTPVGLALTVIDLLPFPFIKNIVNTILWTLGYIAGVSIINLFDRYGGNKYCNPVINSCSDFLKIIVGLMIISSEINLKQVFSHNSDGYDGDGYDD
jgi:hypothetical protein